MQRLTLIHTSIEIAVLILFLIVLGDAVRSWYYNRKKLLLIILAVIYATLFENINMLVARGQVGGYFYSPEFTLWVWDTPLFIILAWASLIYTAMHLSDSLNLKNVSRPFMDALLVVMIDITLDIVATHMGLWTWIGFSSNMGWFGVPADNFIGWMLVTFTFSALFRYFSRAKDDIVNKTTRTEYYFLLPAFAYLSMMVMFSIINLAEDALGLTTGQQLFSFWVLVMVFAAVLRAPNKKIPAVLNGDNYTIFTMLFTRLLFFSFIIWSVVLLELFETNMIAVILLVSLVAEILIYSSAFSERAPRKHSKYLESY